jgi:hypothetical protein
MLLDLELKNPNSKNYISTLYCLERYSLKRELVLLKGRQVLAVIGSRHAVNHRDRL